MLIKFKEEIRQVHLSTYRLRINVKMKHSSVKVQTMPVMEKTRILGSVSRRRFLGFRRRFLGFRRRFSGSHRQFSGSHRLFVKF